MEIHWGSSFVTQAPPHVENHGKEPGYEAIGDHLWPHPMSNVQSYRYLFTKKKRDEMYHLVWSDTTCSLFLVHGIKPLEDDFCTKWRI